jgi:hypothetical protein
MRNRELDSHVQISPELDDNGLNYANDTIKTTTWRITFYALNEQKSNYMLPENKWA